MTNSPRTILLDQFIAHPPSRVWRVLTDPQKLAQWLMPNDFRLEIGRPFTLRGKPIPATRFGGTVYCKVLDYEVERMLRISWDDHGENQLRSTVTWRLEPEGRGTRVFLEHDGFDEHDSVQQLSRKLLGGGWVGVLRKLGELVESTNV
ncbi:SRPBCC domain-containing protein [Saccharopolyspora sp. 5N102]|uniref:SRPBCC domain-containing protein n=1 Tax=Saccharopolyspora sp. 5N102 TaxID=3375155 RepID=UPI003796B363